MLFRGVLLPKMRGVFGKWDWVANSVLFGPYHMHVPLRIVHTAIGALAWTLPRPDTSAATGSPLSLMDLKVSSGS